MALIYRRLERGLKGVNPALRQEALVLIGFIQAFHKAFPKPIKWDSDFGLTPCQDPNRLSLTFRRYQTWELCICLHYFDGCVNRLVSWQLGNSQIGNSCHSFNDVYHLLRWLEFFWVNGMLISQGGLNQRSGRVENSLKSLS